MALHVTGREAMRASLSRLVRRTDAGRTFLDHYLVDIRRSDGSVVRGSRQTSRIFEIWREEWLEEESRQSFEAYEGGDVVDVGAFHGWYALLLSPRARPGDSFLELEPDSRAFPVLLATLEEISRWHPDLRLHALPTAIGNGKPTSVEWPMGPEGHPSFSSSNDASGTPTVTVDGICRTLELKPTFVKIDVEGAEAFVLEGMDETLDTHAPLVMLEIHPRWQPAGYSVDWLIDRMKRHGYVGRELVDQAAARRMLWSKV
jgi:FkbM family methyltransferase